MLLRNNAAHWVGESPVWLLSHHPRSGHSVIVVPVLREHRSIFLANFRQLSNVKQTAAKSTVENPTMESPTRAALGSINGNAAHSPRVPSKLRQLGSAGRERSAQPLSSRASECTPADAVPTEDHSSSNQTVRQARAIHRSCTSNSNVDSKPATPPTSRSGSGRAESRSYDDVQQRLKKLHEERLKRVDNRTPADQRKRQSPTMPKFCLAVKVVICARDPVPVLKLAHPFLLRSRHRFHFDMAILMQDGATTVPVLVTELTTHAGLKASVQSALAVPLSENFFLEFEPADGEPPVALSNHDAMMVLWNEGSAAAAAGAPSRGGSGCHALAHVRRVTRRSLPPTPVTKSTPGPGTRAAQARDSIRTASLQSASKQAFLVETLKLAHHELKQAWDEQHANNVEAVRQIQRLLGRNRSHRSRGSATNEAEQLRADRLGRFLDTFGHGSPDQRPEMLPKNSFPGAATSCVDETQFNDGTSDLAKPKEAAIRPCSPNPMRRKNRLANETRFQRPTAAESSYTGGEFSVGSGNSTYVSSVNSSAGNTSSDGPDSARCARCRVPCEATSVSAGGGSNSGSNGDYRGSGRVKSKKASKRSKTRIERPATPNPDSSWESDADSATRSVMKIMQEGRSRHEELVSRIEAMDNLTPFEIKSIATAVHKKAASRRQPIAALDFSDLLQTPIRPGASLLSSECQGKEPVQECSSTSTATFTIDNGRAVTMNETDTVNEAAPMTTVKELPSSTAERLRAVKKRWASLGDDLAPTSSTPTSGQVAASSSKLGGVSSPILRPVDPDGLDSPSKDEAEALISMPSITITKAEVSAEVSPIKEHERTLLAPGTSFSSFELPLSPTRHPLDHSAASAACSSIRLGVFLCS